jgi:hypothetical protein
LIVVKIVFLLELEGLFDVVALLELLAERCPEGLNALGFRVLVDQRFSRGIHS